MSPSEIPTVAPIKHSSFNPTSHLTFIPTFYPSVQPNKYPTKQPTTKPSMKQSALPSIYSTNYPDESVQKTNPTQVSHAITDNTEASDLIIHIGLSILVCIGCILVMIFIVWLKYRKNRAKLLRKDMDTIS